MFAIKSGESLIIGEKPTTLQKVAHVGRFAVAFAL